MKATCEIGPLSQKSALTCKSLSQLVPPVRVLVTSAHRTILESQDQMQHAFQQQETAVF